MFHSRHYLGARDWNVYALDGLTGQTIWTFPAGGEVSSAPAIGADGTVYVGSWDKKLYALDGATGQKLWEFQTGSAVSSPVMGADGTVYVGADGYYAVDGTTGATRWHLAPDLLSAASSPAIGADGTVYVGSHAGRVYALDGATGRTLWKSQVSEGGYSVGPAIGADGTVYVGAADGVYALCSSSVGGLARSAWPKFQGNAANQGRASVVPGPPRIVNQSKGAIALEGNPMVLRLGTYGTPPLSYEWFFNGQLLAGVTGPRCELAAFTGSQAGVYRARVSNAEGVAESAEMVVALAYQVTLGVVGGGRVSGTSESGAYAAGSVIELTAVPAEGWSFTGWSGDVSSAANPLQLTVDRAWRLTALFGGARPGTKLWEFVTPRATGAIRDHVVGCSPAIATDGTVYVGSLWRQCIQSWNNCYKMGSVYALNGATGQMLWEVPGPAVQSGLAIGASGTLYAPSFQQIPGIADKLYVLDGVNGGRLAAFDSGGVGDVPAIGADGVLYVGTSQGWAYALEGATGRTLWEFHVGGYWVSSPAIGAEETVYLGGGYRTGRVCAVDGRTGQKRWELPVAGEVTSGPAIGWDEIVYVGVSVGPPYSGKVQAVNGATGQAIWESPTGGAVVSSPAIGGDGTVYVGSDDKRLYALDGETGQKRWEFPTGGAVQSSPAIGADGTVYVGSDDGRLYALDGTTGQIRWNFPTGGAVRSSPTIGADGTVYVGSNDGKVYALGSSSVGGLARSPWPKFRHDAQNTGRCPGQPAGIEQQPKRVVLKEGREGRITVEVSGNPAPQMQWFSNGSAIHDGTNATLILPAVGRAMEGRYWLAASNGLGQATSAPISVVVSNVDPESYLRLKWEGGPAGPVSLEATAHLGDLAAWHSISNRPSSSAAQLDVRSDPDAAARFYRLNASEALQLSAAGPLNGWWLAQPASTRIRVEVVSAATGWTNWLVLTDLTLPASPYLFLDLDSRGAPERVYRTTVVP